MPADCIVNEVARILAAFKVLLLAQLREQPLRMFVTLLAIALGVALGAAVYLVNSAALNEFGLATKRLVGEADVVVRGPRDGFDESLFVTLAQDPKVRIASPLLELEVALAERNDSLKILGLDPFRAAAVQPALMADLGGAIFDLFEPKSVYLSASAASRLSLKRGDVLKVILGTKVESLTVKGILSQSAYPQPLGLMDIASAQWTLGALGKLNRIDLQLIGGTDVEEYRRSLAQRLPMGVLAVAPAVERDRAVSVTRAYRVNLNMLALVSLFTGAFLVFSTQSLAVLRRRKALGLLRAIGLTRSSLEIALTAEGALLGLLGSLLGIAIGIVLAGAVLDYLGADLGNGQLRISGATLHAAPPLLLLLVALGVSVASFGAWLPARAAVREPPAKVLKGGDGEYGRLARGGSRLGLLLLAAGAACAFLPAVQGLPVFGYVAIAALLFGAVLLVPSLTVMGLKLTPRSGHGVLDTALAQMRANVGLSTVSLASIIVSFSLMVAMAIMVYSFRVSFEQWLGKLLPADIQMRQPFDNDTAFWSKADQALIASTPGLSRVEFRRSRRLLIDPAKAPITLIVRGANFEETRSQLPLVGEVQTLKGVRVFISEALEDQYGYHPGDVIRLPLGGKEREVLIAGAWRDYARSTGSIVISWQDYASLDQDAAASEASLWLSPGTDLNAAVAGLKAHLPAAQNIEILSSAALRERSLAIFDRAFAVTYALEAVAVLIGLMGVSFAASSTALARRAEFGVLRHIGMLRRQVLGMVASEGVLTSAFGVIYGLILGAALSLVLIYVVNRQSFNWSIDLAIPAWQLAVLSVVLIGAAALTASLSGRAALGHDAVRAVREDW
jgi:putative ABC transport system permease protein